jgi:DNA-binding NtrC family response regulator
MWTGDVNQKRLWKAKLWGPNRLAFSPDGLHAGTPAAAAGRDESIIFITGHGDIPTCAKRDESRRAIDFLPKPFGTARRCD